MTFMLFGNGLSFPFDIKTLSMQKNENLSDDKEILNERIRELEGRIEFLENTIRELLRP